MVLSERARCYRAGVGKSIHQVRPWLPPLPIAGRIKIGLVLHAPNRQKRDIDNFMKCVLDALTHAGVWNDDSQIDDLSIVRGLPLPKNPHVLVTLSEMLERD